MNRAQNSTIWALITQPAPSRGERGYRPKSLLLPRKGTSYAPRVLKIKKGGTTQQQNVPGAQVKDFIPWVCLESSRPADLEEEEEEEMTGLLDCYAARKRKRQESYERELDQAYHGWGFGDAGDCHSGLA